MKNKTLVQLLFCASLLCFVACGVRPLTRFWLQRKDKTCGQHNRRVSAIFEDIKKRSGVTEQVYLCAEPLATSNDINDIIVYLGAWVERSGDGKINLKIGSGYAEMFSHEGLQYIFAHEAGHIALRHLDGPVIIKNGEMELKEKERGQLEADAFAANLVGYNGYANFSKILGREKEVLHKRIAEIEAYRIQHRRPPIPILSEM